MSTQAVAIVAAVLGFLAILGGLAVVARARGTTTRTSTSGTTRTFSTDTANPGTATAKGELSIGKTVSVRRKGSISAVETGQMRARGEQRLPRAVATIVFGFALLMVAIGTLILSAAGFEFGSVLVAAVLYVSAAMLPIGWFKRERAARAEALAN